MAARSRPGAGCWVPAMAGTSCTSLCLIVLTCKIGITPLPPAVVLKVWCSGQQHKVTQELTGNANSQAPRLAHYFRDPGGGVAR